MSASVCASFTLKNRNDLVRSISKDRSSVKAITTLQIYFRIVEQYQQRQTFKQLLLTHAMENHAQTDSSTIPI